MMGLSKIYRATFGPGFRATFGPGAHLCSFVTLSTVLHTPTAAFRHAAARDTHALPLPAILA